LAYRNLSESPFKDLDADEAVGPIYPASVTRNHGIGKGCPQLSSLFAATNGDAFKALPAERDPILEGRRVHLWVHPMIFLDLGCPQMATASELAASLTTSSIQAAESEHPPPSAQELQELASQMGELHAVLAYLWAVSHKLVGAVSLKDLPESPWLNHQCELIQGKVRFPKTRNSGPMAFNQDRAQLRADEATMTFYLKKEFTVAKDVHELQIQVETFRNLLGLLTCHDSVATQGLSIVLHKFKTHYTMIQEMFVTVPQFRLKFLYSLDRQIQRFLEQVSNLKVVAAAHHSLRRFLTQKAPETLLEGIADGIAPSIMLPASLSRPANATKEPVGANKCSTPTPTNKAKEKEKDKTIKEKQMPKGPVSNPEVSPT
jgi:hypothetical protein